MSVEATAHFVFYSYYSYFCHFINRLQALQTIKQTGGSLCFCFFCVTRDHNAGCDSESVYTLKDLHSPV